MLCLERIPTMAAWWSSHPLWREHPGHLEAKWGTAGRLHTCIFKPVWKLCALPQVRICFHPSPLPWGSYQTRKLSSRQQSGVGHAGHSTGKALGELLHSDRCHHLRRPLPVQTGGKDLGGDPVATVPGCLSPPFLTAEKTVSGINVPSVVEKL